MTREHWKNLLPIIEAFANGKEVQFRKNSGDWSDILPEDSPFNYGPDRYRIKPEPKLRPWREGEIPLGALWRFKGYHTIVYTPVSVHNHAINFSSGTYSYTCYDLFRNCEHSLDNGRTWLPCGVMEDGE